MTKKKEVLWISHLIPYPPKGGVLQRSYHLVRELAGHHNVHLVAFVQKKLINTHFTDYDEGISEAKEHLLHYCKSVCFISIPCESSKYGQHQLAFKALFSKTGYTVDWLTDCKMHRLLKQLASNQAFDTVVYDTISLIQYQGHFPEAKAILDHHNIESDMMLRRAANEQNLLKKLYFWQEGKKLQYYERVVCTTADLNITCSELDSEKLMQLAPSAKATTIPNGVDINYFNCAQNRNYSLTTPTFIFAGRLSAYTNKMAAHYIAFKLWPELKKQFPGSTFLIIGSDPQKELLALDRSDPNFIVTGYVDDVRDYLEKADLYICPITDGGGTKLKVLDALASGIPLIADPIACEGINVENNKSVLFASSITEYSKCVKHLINNPNKVRLLSGSGRELAENTYSFETIVNNFSKVIDNL